METSAASAGVDHRLQMPWFHEASLSSKVLPDSFSSVSILISLVKLMTWIVPMLLIWPIFLRPCYRLLNDSLFGPVKLNQGSSICLSANVGVARRVFPTVKQWAYLHLGAIDSSLYSQARVEQHASSNAFVPAIPLATTSEPKVPTTIIVEH